MACHARQFLALLVLLATNESAAKCVKDHSLGKCEACITSVQCGNGRFCCPYLKKCVKDSKELCGYPIASCIPVCRDSADPKTCQCENKQFPDNWVKCDGGSAEGGGAVTSQPEPNPIRRVSATNGYCVGFFKNTYCWLADKTGKPNKNGNPYTCTSYIGYSADEWCYGSRRSSSTNRGGSTGTTGTSRGSGGGSSGGQSSSGKFSCPSRWYAGSKPTDPQAKEWTMAHNVFRCMHEVPFAQWSNPVADSIKRYLADKTYMVHSDSYDVRPPAGPAGENLFSGYPASAWKPANAASDWYSEIKKCSKFPGCNGKFSMSTGHFTAMIWSGATKLGCTSNAHGVKGCRYKGSDRRGATTPNMGGYYSQNLPGKKKSLSACKAIVKKCFGGSTLPDGIKAFSVEAAPVADADDVFEPAGPLRLAAAGAAVAGLVSLAALAAVRLRARRPGLCRRRAPCDEGVAMLATEGPAEEKGELAAEGL